ncbi:UDP-3-O-(3-hydroxymyristoyl)glucosamine N-acyltransferase [Pelagibacterales bacterium SAG-MED31]|nr:UDP-3-O-(3-hydroxymyristoyl)glucosamine N-acyltransferase [Pelagibacterales bacterium SAG-MED31]
MKINTKDIKILFSNNNISYLTNLQDNDTLESICSITNAVPNSLIFLFNEKYLNVLNSTKAKCCVLKKEYLNFLPKKIKYIVVEDPYLVFAHLSNIFYEVIKSNGMISKNVIVDNGTQINKNVQIDNFTQIHKNSIIEKNVLIESNCTIGPNVYIADNVSISSNCSLSNCIIEENTIIKSGVVIGGEGFGFEINSKKRIRHFGNVIIGKNCYIGANTSIDRAVLESTIISDNSNLDNLIQIAHNVKIGKHAVIAAQVGIAGSTVIGDYVKIGGQAGVSGHLSIGDNVTIAAKSGVTKNLINNQIVAGFPAIDIKKWKRNVIKFNKTDDN